MLAPPQRRRPKPDRRRALELLAASRDGCTEALMIYSRDIEGFVEGTARGPSP
jgi:hypothetical protein